MLREIRNERLISERRRWFTDDYMDVYVWYDENSTMLGFQVCFDKGKTEKAFTWFSSGFNSMDVVDTGDDSPLKNMTPILMPLKDHDKRTLKKEFRIRSKEIERQLAQQLLEIIEQIANPYKAQSVGGGRSPL